MTYEARRPGSSLHVGFLAQDFIRWDGGVWFIQNLLRGLATVPESSLHATIFAPSDTRMSILLRRFARKLVQAAAHPSQLVRTFASASPERARWQRGVAQLTAIVPQIVIYNGSEADLLRQCRRRQIDVLMPVMTPLANRDLPWVGYLYDCQHKRYPEFFSTAEITARDATFEKMLCTARVVFANARTVVSDLQTFFPAGRSALFSLPFAPLIRAEEFDFAVAGARKAGQMAGARDYFIICNQFWVHKDHATAFRAFARFVGSPRYADHRLVCTGLMQDFRMPGHVAALLALVTELGISDRVVFTGYIDRAQQQALLYGAIALLQPTRFEGGPGGGAASDAIALGVPCILSDIPVNRELVNRLASFFRVGDFESLAESMDRLVATPPPRPAREAILDSSRSAAQNLGESLLGLAVAARAA